MKLIQNWKWILLTAACFGAVIVWALPSVLGSKWVYQPLVDRLADERFQLRIGSVRLGWLQPISFEQIRLEVVDAQPSQAESDSSQSTSNDSRLISIDAIRSNRSLLGFLFNGRNLGTVEIDKPNIDIRLLEDGSNLERLIRAIEAKAPREAATPSKPKKAPPEVNIEIIVRGFHVSVTDQQSGQPVMVIPPFDTTIAYNAIDVDSQLVIEPTQALDQVAITQELVHLGLSKAVPLLANSTEFDGRISLKTGRITVPLQHPQDTIADVELTLHQVRTVPTHPTILASIDFLGRMFRTDLPHELVFVDGSKIHVQVADRFVKHDGVRAGLPKVDDRLQIATSGSVGLVDRSLNLGIEIPVPLEQLAHKQSLKQLGVPSITLPIRGTLDEPELDWNAFRQDSAGLLSAMSGVLNKEAPLASNVVGALSEVAGGETDQAIETGMDLVKQIIQHRQEKAKENRDSEQASDSENADPARSGKLRDRFKNLMRGKK